MAYRHGVYTSEVETSVQAAQPVDSALPFVVGCAPHCAGPAVVSSWAGYCEAFGEATSATPTDRRHTLTCFAYYWFNIAGRGECVFQSIPGEDFSSSAFTASISSQDAVVHYEGSVGTVADAPAVRAGLDGAEVTISLADSTYSVSAKKADGSAITATIGSTSSPASFTLNFGASAGTVTFSLKDAAGDSASSAVFGDGVTSVAVKLSIMANADTSGSDTIAAIASIHTIYERFGRVASILCAPVYCENPVVFAAMVSAVSNIGGRFRGIALGDIPAGYVGETAYTADEAQLHKPSTDPNAILSWPYIGVGNYRFAGSVALCAALNATDGQNGSLPYVSPSNKQIPVTGSYMRNSGAESTVWLTREDENSKLGAHGIVGFRNTALGWVPWGDNTAAFPGNTDVKDYMIPIRRMFGYVSNMFQIFADGRIDAPLNQRQLEGVVKSFNQILAGWIGFGALNAATIELDAERNTPASMLSGVVYFRIRIAPPPAMVVIEGVLEYDVSGFAASLA